MELNEKHVIKIFMLLIQSNECLIYNGEPDLKSTVEHKFRKAYKIHGELLNNFSYRTILQL